MKPGKTALVLVAMLVAALSACDKKQAADDRGPAEKAGQQIDQAASRAGEELNKAAGKLGQGMQQAGEKLQNEASRVQAQKNEEGQKKE